MLVGALMVLFWILVALLGAMGALVFVIAIGRANT